MPYPSFGLNPINRIMNINNDMKTENFSG